MDQKIPHNDKFGGVNMKDIIVDNKRFKLESGKKQNNETENNRRHITTSVKKTELEHPGNNFDYIWWLI